MSNLRQVIKTQMQDEKQVCKCVRCREVGKGSQKEKLYLIQQEYDASGAKEIFLSFENKTRTRLYALLRLRLERAPGAPRGEGWGRWRIAALRALRRGAGLVSAPEYLERDRIGMEEHKAPGEYRRALLGSLG